jgi:hypothetical protein
MNRLLIKHNLLQLILLILQHRFCQLLLSRHVIPPTRVLLLQQAAPLLQVLRHLLLPQAPL